MQTGGREMEGDEVFTLPHVIRAESEDCPSCPRTVLGLHSD